VDDDEDLRFCDDVMRMGMMTLDTGSGILYTKSLFLIEYRELFVLIDVACGGLEGVLSSLWSTWLG
jgi:hypothetical protein